MDRIKLFCFPYAGGSAMVYTSWKKLMHPAIEVIPIELAGRGAKTGVPFYENIAKEGMDDVYKMMEAHLDGSAFALFGHSMGTLFAYEASYRIKAETNQSPVHIFFSGRGAPHCSKHDKVIHQLPDLELQQEVVRLGGTPKEVFEQKPLADLFTPILRADYRLVETYGQGNKTEKLSCDITALWGTHDTIMQADAESWRDYTQQQFHLEVFDGDHFFINSCKQQVIDAIQHRLLVNRLPG